MGVIVFSRGFIEGGTLYYYLLLLLLLLLLFFFFFFHSPPPPASTRCSYIFLFLFLLSLHACLFSFFFSLFSSLFVSLSFPSSSSSIIIYPLHILSLPSIYSHFLFTLTFLPLFFFHSHIPVIFSLLYFLFISPTFLFPSFPPFPSFPSLFPSFSLLPNPFNPCCTFLCLLSPLPPSPSLFFYLP